MNHEKVAILVDSGSDVPAELLERYHIFMIPLKILFHEAEYLDGLTIDACEVYRRLPTEIPKTSLPDGGLITSVLDRIYQEGYRKVLAICISGNLSGTCNLASSALRRIRRAGMLCHRLEKHLHRQRHHRHPLCPATGRRDGFCLPVPAGTADDWRQQNLFLFKNAGISAKGWQNRQAGSDARRRHRTKTGHLLQRGGLLLPDCQDHRRTPSIRKVLELAQKFAEGCPKVMLAVMHGDAPEEAQALAEEVRRKIPQGIVEVRGQISPALGVHTGPGLVGICVLKME